MYIKMRAPFMNGNPLLHFSRPGRLCTWAGREKCRSGLCALPGSVQAVNTDRSTGPLCEVPIK
ncbi:unnamed protein product [Staurois parvus]|uniref:Uncharacterized protein n=1 Tax=Staurois parvus TaxID=386267 RepID=A0ABN9CV37_9NEOB|nr:unnamed protein product [Staurois parvus]